MGNAWMDLVKKTSSENKGKSLHDILQMSKIIYRKQNNGNTQNNNNFKKNKIANKTRNRKTANFKKSRNRR